MKLFEKINFNVTDPIKHIATLQSRLHPHIHWKATNDEDKQIQVYFRAEPVMLVNRKQSVFTVTTLSKNVAVVNAMNDILHYCETHREIKDGELKEIVWN